MSRTRHQVPTEDHACRRRLQHLRDRTGEDEPWRLTPDELEELKFLEEHETRSAKTEANPS